jgi:hypothetical protein
MRHFILIAAVAVGLAIGGTAVAGGKGKGGSSSSHSRVSGNYFKSHGVHFKYGYYYKGRDHHHWRYCYWSPSWGCYFYLDPDCNCYYYWCAAENCYYPATYINTAPPKDAGKPPSDVPVVSPPEGTE